jgi:transposase-like protein
MKKRRNYDPTFRGRVALEALRGNRTLAAIAGEYKVHPNMIVRWKKELVEKLPTVFQKPDDAELKEALEQNDELYKEIGKLKMEVDYLKKKLLI